VNPSPASMNPLDYGRDFGWRAAADHVATYVLMRLFRRGFHQRAVPRHEELHQGAQLVSPSAHTIVTDYVLAGRNEADLAQIQREHDALYRELGERYASRALPYPRHYEVEKESSLLLYALVRATGPDRVVETGVANGASSFFLLHALRKNGRGQLASVDVRGNVGGLLDDSERREWRLTILGASRRGAQFKSLVADGPPIDVFLHDSDHRYLWQMLELESAVANMATRSIVLCDDADSSYAFLDYCHAMGRRPAYLAELRKVLGLLRIDEARR